MVVAALPRALLLVAASSLVACADILGFSDLTLDPKYREGGVDSGEPEGSADTGSDAGTDTGFDAGAEAGPWCATQDAAFCADFDESTDLASILGTWTTTSSVNGLFDLDTRAGVPSPPNALRVTTTNTSGVQTLVSQHIQAFPMPATHLRLEFDLRIDQAGPVGFLSAAGLAGIALGPGLDHGVVGLAIGSGPTLIAFYLQPASADAGAAGLGTASSSAPFPNTGAWDGRFAVDVTYTSSSGCLQLYQGNSALTSCLSLPASLLDPTDLWIDMGVSGIGNTGTVVLSIDDVTFQVR